MKNSKVTVYALLALVVGIWGYVIYTVFANVNDTPVPTLQTVTKKLEKEDLNYYRWKDDLAYDTIYQSPFAQLQQTATTEPLEEPTPNAPVSSTQQNYNTLAYAPAMDIRYLGFIENEEKKQRVALLQINGKQYYMHKNEKNDGVTLLDVQNENIKVKTSHQTLTITKNSATNQR